jgi:hypothetical protein
VGSFRFGPGEIDVRVGVALHIHDVDANKPARQPYRSHISYAGAASAECLALAMSRFPSVVLGLAPTPTFTTKAFPRRLLWRVGCRAGCRSFSHGAIGFGLLDVLSTAGSLTYRPPAGLALVL